MPSVNSIDLFSGDDDFRVIQNQLVELAPLDRTIDDRWDIVEALQERLEGLTSSQLYEQAAHVNAAIKQLEDLHLSNYTLDSMLRQITSKLLSRRQTIIQLESEMKSLSSLQHDIQRFLNYIGRRQSALLEYIRTMQEGRREDRDYQRLLQAAKSQVGGVRLMDPNLVQRLHTQPASMLEAKRYTSSKRKEYALGGSFKGAFGSFSYQSLKKNQVLRLFDVQLLIGNSDSSDRANAVQFLRHVHFIFSSSKPGGDFQLLVVYDQSSVIEVINLHLPELQTKQRQLELTWRPSSFPLLEFRVSKLCELLEQLEVGLIVV